MQALPAPLRTWFETRGWSIHPHQQAMLDRAAETALLLIAPTGGGKTLAGFLPTLAELAENPAKGLHTLYISPLKALAADIRRNLTGPAREMGLRPGIAVAAGLIDDLRPYEPLLAQVHGPLPPRAVLVHADLYVRHVLVDDASRACGVIDWGDVHLGHPGLDLALAFSLLPPSARSRFARAYGPIDDESWALGRQRGLLYGAVLCAYGLDIGDSALVAEGQQALRWVLE